MPQGPAYLRPLSDDSADFIWDEVLGNSTLRGARAARLQSVSGARTLQRLEFDLIGSYRLGLQVLAAAEGSEPCLVVTRVDPEGMLSQTVDGGPGVCPGDVIVEVHGQRGNPEALLAMLQDLAGSSGELNITVRPRPAAHVAEIARTGRNWQRLGVSVLLKPDKTFFVVAAVHETGLVPEWNAANSGHACLCAGDKIVGVNGLEGSAAKLYSHVQAAGLGSVLRLDVHTPPRAFSLMLQAWAAKAAESGVNVERI